MIKIILLTIMFMTFSVSSMSYKDSDLECMKNGITNQSNPCMYNAKCDCYQKCYHVTATGKCVHFGGACRP